MRDKVENRAAGGKDGKPKILGRKNGHRGVSHGRKFTVTVTHRPKGCPKCGSPEMEDTGRTMKQVLDIPFIPKCTVTTHVKYECRCAKCGTLAKESFAGSADGTPLGPNLLTLATGMWYRGLTLDDIRDLLTMFGARISKATVQHAMAAVGRRLKPKADGIARELAGSEYLKMDETPVVILDKRGYLWVGDDLVVFKVAGTRGRAVIYEFFPYLGRPLTADGLSVYEIFDVL